MQDRAKLRRGRAWGILLTLVIAAMTVVVFVRDPSREVVAFCVLRSFTGYLCPACGGTRAAHALLHLRPLEALRMNPFLTLMMPAMAYMLAAEIVRLLAGRYILPPVTPKPWLIIVLGAAFLLFGILRNLPSFAFLAPPA